MFINLYENFYYISKTNFEEDSFINLVYSCPNTVKDDFHRYIYTKSEYRNLSLICDTKFSQYSSSNINYNVKQFYKKIGAFVSGSHYYLTSENSDLIKKLLSIKYQANMTGTYIMIDNPLSIGYTVKQNYENNKVKNPFDYQNNLVSNMVGEKIEPLKSFKKLINVISENENKSIYNITDKEKIYFYIWHDTEDIVFPLNFAKVYINKKLEFNYNGINDNYGIRKIKNDYIGEIEILTKLKKNERSIKYFKYYNINNNWLYYEDKESVDYVISELSKNQLNITKMEKNTLEGNINVGNRRILFLSIPYEKGWNIYVDGKKLTILRFMMLL